MDERIAFERHARALLLSSQGFPPSVVATERRLAKAIRDAGLAGRLPHLLAGVAETERKADEPFEIFVVGEGKFGKSTLINALLGLPAAPTDFLPKTWCFNRYVALDKPLDRVRVFVDPHMAEGHNYRHLRATLSRKVGSFRGLTEYQVGQEAAARLVAEEERRVADGLGSEEPYYSPILEMEWQVRAERALLPGIRLVDTMGMNQKLAPDAHLHHLKWQYERADAVLWLVSSDKIGAKDTRDELEEASRYAKLLYVVVNRWEELQDQAEAMRRCEAHYGRHSTAIIPISALAAFLLRAPEEYQPTPRDAQWRRKHRADTQAKLEDLSGFCELRRHLGSLVEERRNYARNLQPHAALKRKTQEFRRMALTARDDATANLQLHDGLSARIEDARLASERKIDGAFATLIKTMRTQVSHAIDTVDYDSRKEARSLLGLERIRNDVRIVERRESLEATRRYADVLTWSAGESRRYVESEFAATGEVAWEMAIASTALTEVDVDPIPVEWELPNPDEMFRDLLIGAGELLSGLPMVGDWIKDKVREAKATATRTIRTALREGVLSQVEVYVLRVEDKLGEANEAVAINLLDDADSQFAESGGREAHERAIARVDEVMGRTILEPILVKAPLDAMRRRGWRRDGAALR